MLKVQEVARRLNCSQATVYRLIESGRLPHFRCPGIRVSEDQLSEYLASCTAKSRPRREAGRILRQRLKHIHL